MPVRERGWFIRLKRNHELVFLFALFVLFSSLIVETFRYAPDPRLVPLLTLSTMTILTGLGILMHLFNEYDIPVLNDVIGGGIRFVESNRLFSLDTEELELRVADDEEMSLSRFARASGWVFAFVLGFYLFGMMNVVPIVLFLFLYIESDVSLSVNIGITVLTVVLVYVMFIEFLDILLYPGLIPDAIFG